MALNGAETAAANALFDAGLLPISVHKRLGISMVDAVLAWRAWQVTHPTP